MEQVHRGNYRQGVLYMLLCTFALSLLSLFSKLVLVEKEIFLFLFSRYFLTFLAFLPFLLWTGVLKKIVFDKNLLPVVYRGFLAMVSLNLFFYCLIHTSLFDSTVLFNTGPIFIPLLAKLFFNAQIDKKVWWSISLSFIGVLFVMQPDAGIFNFYSISGVLAGFFTAVNSLLVSRAISAGAHNIPLGSFYFLLIASFFSALLLLGFNGIYEGDLTDILVHFVHMPFHDWMIMAATVICMIINQISRGYAFRLAPVEKLAPFMYSVIVFSGIFDWLVFHNPPDLFSLLGSGLVITGVFLELHFQKAIY
jgi:drug/metabolite transporter (DMT)-like permease